MGNQLAVSGGAATVNTADISASLNLVAPLGGRKRGRLFTSLHCTESGRNLVVKVFVRTGDKEQGDIIRVEDDLIRLFAERLAALEQKLRAYYAKNSGVPCNTLFYSSYTKTERFCMLQRPFLHYSLPERLEIRPFLTQSQRLFLGYQLFMGLHQLHHTFSMTHGDLKSENVLITTGGWLYITDLAPFKPPRLYSTNPADFEYYYDNAEQRVCCLAPERFVDPAAEGSSDPSSTAAPGSAGGLGPSASRRFGDRVTPSMDVFSAGCVFFHLLSDEVLFKLSDILEFRHKSFEEKKEYIYSRLSNSPRGNLAAQVGPLLADALCTPADVRPSLKELVDKHTPSIFPPFFHFLYYNVMPSTLGLPPDLQIQSVWNRYDDILAAAVRYTTTESGEGIIYSGDHPPSSSAAELEGEKEEGERSQEGEETISMTVESVKEHQTACLDLLLPVICIALKHAKLLDSKAKALRLIHNAAKLASEDVKRDLLLPHVLPQVTNRNNPSIVRAGALRALQALCEALSDFPLRECLMYEDLILPALYTVFTDERPLILSEIATVMPKVMCYALSYVDRRQSMGNCMEWTSTYDFQRHSVVDRGWELLKPLFSHGNSSVVCAVLSAVPDIAQALGREKTQGELLPLLMTLLGAQGVETRRANIKQVVHLALFLKNPKNEIVKVCIEEALRDNDPECILTALEGATKLVREKECLPEGELMRIVQSSVVLLGYPDQWVAQAAAKLLEESAKEFDPVDVLVSLEGAVRPLLRYPVALTTLSQNQDFIKPIANMAATNVRSSTTQRTEYQRRYDLNAFRVPSDAMVRTAGDIPCDKCHIDVGERLQCKALERAGILPTAVPGRGISRATLVHPPGVADSTSDMELALSLPPGVEPIWRMSDFHPTTRQMKRLMWRLWKPDAKATSGLDAPRFEGGATTGRRGTPAATQQQRGRTPTVVLHGTGHLIPEERYQNMAPIAATLAFSTEHEGPVYSLAACGQFLASGGIDSKLRIWNIDATVFPPQSGASILTPQSVKTVTDDDTDHGFSATPRNRSAATLSGPNSSTLSAAAKDTVLVTQFLTPQLIACGTSSGHLSFYDLDVDDMTGHAYVDGGLSCVVPYTNTGSMMMLGTHRGGLYAYDRRAGKEVWSAHLQRSQGPVSSLLVADQFGLIAGTLRGAIAIFDLRFRREMKAFQVAAGHVAHTARCVHSMAHCTGPSDAPSIAVATENADILRYSLRTLEETLCMHPAIPRSTRVLMGVPRTPTIVSGGTDNIIRLWNLNQPERSTTLTCPPAKSPPYNFSRGAQTVAESNNPPAATGLPRMHHRDAITALACPVVRQQQYLVSGARDGVIKLWHNHQSL